MSVKRISSSILSILLGLGFVALAISLAIASSQIDIPGPSGEFGGTVIVLPNGNILVSDLNYDAGSIADVGAVYLYDGGSTTLISMLTGSTADDQVGSGGVTVLANGNFVLRSPYWDNGPVVDAGAATWVDGTSGLTGTVSAANSLVGSAAGDNVGWRVTVLANGNYVVGSGHWDNGAEADAGAVTWGDGTSGVTGTVSAANSLVGSSAGDEVGWGMSALSNGNYVVGSSVWDNGSVVDAGAATWGDGTSGVTGTVSAANSLVGSSAGDYVGGWGVIALTNGNYVVISAGWDNGPVFAGAVTWGDGTSGVTGTVNTANSLVGSTAVDQVGDYVTALANGNYLVGSPRWANGVAVRAGAVTWGDGTSGVTGTVSAANSLVGSSADDSVGEEGVTELTNGNYLVWNPNWDNGAVHDAGAVTWGDGTSGVTGEVSAINSLVGSTAYDRIGTGGDHKPGFTELANGNYLVRSHDWNYGAGAVTWGDGTSGVTGTVSAANSLVGSTAYDQVGGINVWVLANGNYVVGSPSWSNGPAGGGGGGYLGR